MGKIKEKSQQEIKPEVNSFLINNSQRFPWHSSVWLAH